MQTEAVESTPPLDSIHTQVTEKDAKPTPDWVFGTWQVETEYGIIEVRVAGKWLRETSAGGTCHSTFFYSKGQLNCDFPDRHRTVRSYYRLDEVHHRIDAGEGLWMKKISDR